MTTLVVVNMQERKHYSFKICSRRKFERECEWGLGKYRKSNNCCNLNFRGILKMVSKKERFQLLKN